MRSFPIALAIAAILVGYGCAGAPRTASRGTTRMDRLVEVEPIRTTSAWKVPGDLEKYPKVLARYVGESAPSVDGNLADWGAGDWVSVGDAEHYSGEGWEGPDDCSYRIALAYDAKQFYVGAEVTDDVWQQGSDGEEIWRGDSFQLGIDPDLDRAKNHYADDDVELGWAVKPTGDGGSVWRWTAPRGMAPGPLAVPIGVSTDKEVTRFELAIPLTELGDFSPGMLDRCGVSFMYNDNDRGVDQDRDGVMEWTPSIAEKKDPSSFGVLQFGPAPEEVFPKIATRLKAIKTVSECGSTLEFRLELIAGRGAGDGTLTLIFDDGRESLTLTKRTVPVLEGRKAYAIRVDTSHFPVGAAKLLVRFTAADGGSTEGTYRVYVYAPVKWGT